MSARSMHHLPSKTNLLCNGVHMPCDQVVAVRMVERVEAVGVSKSDQMRLAGEEVKVEHLEVANLLLSYL